MAQPNYYEDWVVGHVYTTASRKVTNEIIAHFNEVEGHKGVLHNDPEFAKTSIWGKLTAHGLLMVVMASGMMADMNLFDGPALAFLGLTWKFHAPVLTDDELHVRWWVREKRLTSKPGRGIIVRQIELINQNGETVCSGDMTSLWSCRDSSLVKT